MYHRTSLLNTNVSTLNFVLCFIGYALVTSLFLPITVDIEGVSRLITIPYRAFALGVSLLTLWLNLQNSIKLTTPTKLFILFWIALLCRMVYDLELRYDLHIPASDKNDLWLITIFTCFVPTIAVIKSINSIDLNKAFYWIYSTVCIILVLQLFSNAALIAISDSSERVDGSVALNTISFGHTAAMAVLLSVSYYRRNRESIWKKLIAWIIALFGMFVMLRTGSRGPLISLIVPLLIYLFAVGRSDKRNWIIIPILFVFIALFWQQILDVVKYISPVMYDRMSVTILEGDTNNRNPLIESAINYFLDNPLFGGQFCLYVDGKILYSHNLILDAFMGLGLYGGILFCYLCYKSIRISIRGLTRYTGYEWVFLIILQRLMAGMTSGAFYTSTLLSVLIAFVFMKYSNDSQPQESDEIESPL